MRSTPRPAHLYSIAKAGNEFKEIRVPKNFGSIVGFTALSRHTINVKDAHDAKELQQLHPKLTFDTRWDKQSNFRTTQVLAVPITFEKSLLGVIQVINRKGGGRFTREEAGAVEEIAKTIGIAFHNQRKVARTSKPSKYGLVIDKGLISEQDVQAAVSDARVLGSTAKMLSLSA